MKVLVILAHPEPGSFNHAIAEEVRKALSENGYQDSLRDLYAERFDGILPAGEIPEDAQLDPVVREQAVMEDPREKLYGGIQTGRKKTS